MPLRTTSPLAQAAPRLHWKSQLAQRVRHLLWLKLSGITAFTWLFFEGYFYLLRHPARPPIQMPLTALDMAISHQPGAFAAYVSLWVYVGIAPGLMPTLRDLIAYGLWAGALCLSGLMLFYLVPTAVPPVAIPVDLVQHPVFQVLQGVDAAGNACPSMHVASALFSAVGLNHLLRQIAAPRGLRVINAAWLLAIVYSTLAIKQHVVIDVLAGAALGGVWAWACLRGFAATTRLLGATR